MQAPRSPGADRDLSTVRANLAARLRAIVGAQWVIDEEEARAVYRSDALTAYAVDPLLIVLPATTSEVAAVLAHCHAEGVPIVPRGAGTSLSGGALPDAQGIVLGLSRMNRVLEIDYANRVAIVQPGVTNLGVSEAVSARGFHFAPDPSSQIACTIGGNVAENAGGVHCLKYGLTTNNVLGVELVLPDGEVLRLGGRHLESREHDLLSVVIGSEGLLGIVTEATLRIVPRPEHAVATLMGFGSVGGACDFVAAVIAAGIIPAGMEMMDNLAIRATEAFAGAGYPVDAAALVIVELDGIEVECSELAYEIAGLGERHGAYDVRTSKNEAERLIFWAGRKAAFPAAGRMAPDYLCMDGTIPRRRLSEALARIAEMAAVRGLAVANVFHAGDGNLHPLILYDGARPFELESAEALGADILRLCIEMGGVLSGEHGIGVEKIALMPEMFSDLDLRQQQRVKCAFDPAQRMNPGKMFPVLHRCAELGRVHVSAGRLPFPELPRF